MAYSKERTDAARAYFGPVVDGGEIDPTVDGGEIDAPVDGLQSGGISPTTPDEESQFLAGLRAQNDAERPVEDTATRDLLDGNLSEVDYYKKIGAHPPASITGGRSIEPMLRQGTPEEIAASRTSEDGVVHNFDKKGDEITGKNTTGYVAPGGSYRGGGTGDASGNNGPQSPVSAAGNASVPGNVPYAEGMAPHATGAPVATSARPGGSAGAGGPSAPREETNPYAAAADKDPNADSVLPGITNKQAADLWYDNHPGTGPHNKLGYRVGDFGKMMAQGENTARMIEVGGAKEAAEAAKLKDLYDQQANDANLRIEERKHEESVRQAHVQEQMAKLDSATDDAKKAELDGSSYLSRNPISGILGALSAIVGGAYAGLTGRENEGLKGLNAAITRDIDIQKYNLDKKQQNVRNQTSLLGQMREQFGDQRDAEKATEIALRQASADKLVGMAEGVKNVKMKNDILLMAQQTRNGALNARAELERAAYLSAHMAVRGGATGGAPKVKQDELNELYVPAFNGYARNKKEAGELRTRSEAALNIRTRIDTIMSRARKVSTVDKLANKVGYETQDLEDLIRETEQVTQPLTQFIGGGAQAEAEAKRAVKGIVGSLRLGRPVEDAVNQFKTSFDKQYTDMPKAFGIQKGEEGYGINREGQVAPVGQYNGQTATPRPALPSSVTPRK